MSNEVNLILSRRKEESVAFRQIDKVKRVAYMSLAGCVFVTLLFFVLNFTSGLSSLTQKETDLNQQLQVSQKKIIKLSFIRDRLHNVTSLANAHSKYESLIAQISDALPIDSNF